MDIRDSFKVQLEKMKPVTEEGLQEMSNKKFHSGKNIKIGDKILCAFLINDKNKDHNGFPGVDIIKLGEDEIDNFELYDTLPWIEENNIPFVKIKQFTGV